MGYDPVLVRRSRARQGGQAIIMVTLALAAMCGLLGLAVDFGWAYFVKRAAQGAADAAATAAAEEMRRMVGFTGPYPCYNGGTCRGDNAPYDCTSSVVSVTTDNLDNACLYARDNGFVSGGRQSVKVSEGSAAGTSPTPEPPTLPGVPLMYWVTVRVSESVPQLFAAVTGNPYATVSARATAGIYQGTIRGSIILTNRENDTANWSGGAMTGTNLAVTGNANVSTTGGGILMASGCNGMNCGGNYAGVIQGSQATVTAESTSIRALGAVSISGNNQARWDAAPTNGGSATAGDTSSQFLDPMRKKAPIPVSGAGLTDCPIPGGVIQGTSTAPVVLGPGRYYSVPSKDNNGKAVSAGDPIQIVGDVKFMAGGRCLNGGVSEPNGFGTYVIYGGIQLKPAGQGGGSMEFESGAIVMAGAKPTSSGNANPLMDLQANGSFALTGPAADKAGNVFVFTDPNYPQLGALPTDLSNVTLKQGVAGFKSGNNTNVTFNLNGLNDGAPGLPSTLMGYNSVVMWQDRRNSSVLYNSNDGEYACLPPYLDCTKSDPQKATDGVVPGSQELYIAAGATSVINGTIYQPRGAWTTIGGSAGLTSALQLITGALNVTAGGNVGLRPVTKGVPISIVGLVE